MVVARAAAALPRATPPLRTISAAARSSWLAVRSAAPLNATPRAPRAKRAAAERRSAIFPTTRDGASPLLGRILSARSCAPGAVSCGAVKSSRDAEWSRGRRDATSFSIHTVDEDKQDDIHFHNFVPSVPVVPGTLGTCTYHLYSLPGNEWPRVI